MKRRNGGGRRREMRENGVIGRADDAGLAYWICWL